ncbi:MAG: glycosyltransferase family 4 protein [Candidatus Methylomirabilis sp.]
MKRGLKPRKSESRPFIVYWNNIPSPYMVERFNALADRDAFEFEAWFNDRIHSDRSWTVDEAAWRFRHRYLPTTHLFGRIQHWPLLVLGRRPDVLVSLYAEPAFMTGWAIAKLRGAKTGFRVLMTYDRWVSRHPIKESMKRFLFQRVDAIETPGEEGKRFAMRYGASQEKIFFATHTIDIPHFETACCRGREERDALRSELGLEGTTFIYVGRLWWGKGINYLLDAFEAVQRQSAAPVSLLLVGDGPDEAKLKQACAERGIRNVVFAGFRQKPDLPRYYALADVFVFPTLGDPYGLVVDEAMACGLPIISTSAAGEIRDRIEEGVNGYIVPPEDSAALADAMRTLAEDVALRERMGPVSAQKIQGHTSEQWAVDFERIVHTLLAKEP